MRGLAVTIDGQAAISNADHPLFAERRNCGGQQADADEKNDSKHASTYNTDWVIQTA
jgi:hypothetical protein